MMTESISQLVPSSSFDLRSKARAGKDRVAAPAKKFLAPPGRGQNWVSDRKREETTTKPLHPIECAAEAQLRGGTKVSRQTDAGETLSRLWQRAIM
jgi:hypothetical protein